MIYFFDTEFIEGFHKPLFGKRRHFIDLISIGIVSGDNREYYAISNEFDIKKAYSDWWLLENILTPIYFNLAEKDGHDFSYLSKNVVCIGKHQYNNFKRLLKKYGKSNKQISLDIYKFVTEPLVPKEMTNLHQRIDFLKHNYNPSQLPLFEFYGYYSDYDWVLLCSLFGRMTSLPFGFPMYARDLKQMLDELSEKYANSRHINPEEILKEFKGLEKYPKQTDEHNALSDAKFNKQLFEFIKTLK